MNEKETFPRGEAELNPEIESQFCAFDERAKRVARQIEEIEPDHIPAQERKEIVSRLELVMGAIIALSGLGVAGAGLYGENSIIIENAQRLLHDLPQLQYSEAIESAIAAIGLGGAGVAAAGIYDLFNAIRKIAKRQPN